MAYRSNLIHIPVQIGTITGLAGGAVVGMAAPFAGTIVSINAAVNGAFTVSNIVITGRINTTNITNGVVTINQSGSAFGSTSSATPTGLNVFNANDILNCTITGGVGAVSGCITFVVSKN